MRNKNNRLIYLLAILKFILPFVLQNSAFGLHRDEFLYYQQGHHLAFGFLENPPIISLLASVSALLGGSFFWIKFWPSLFGALTLLLAASIAKEFGGKIFGQLIAALGVFFSAYLRVHFLFQPNFLEIFFWTLSAYFLIRYINHERAKDLYLLSISLALGWWSKYSLLFFAAALILSILLTRQRKLFGQKNFWLAALSGLLLITPNILWQWAHHWPLVHHMDELRETQLKYIDRSAFLKDQLLMLLSVSFIWIGGLIWLLRNNSYRIISYIYIIVIVLVMMGSGKAYYTLGVYPMLLAAGGVWLENITRHTLWARYVLASFILTLSLTLLPLLLPLQSPSSLARFNEKYHLAKIGLLKWEDQENHPLQQDFADMLGWKELAHKTEDLFNSLPDSTKNQTVIYCSNYGQAGALMYYAHDNKFRSKIISANGSFLLWIPNHLRFRHFIFVGEKQPAKDHALFREFAKTTLVDSVTNRLSRQYGNKIIFYQNASVNALPLAAKMLRSMKAEFGE